MRRLALAGFVLVACNAQTPKRDDAAAATPTVAADAAPAVAVAAPSAAPAPAALPACGFVSIYIDAKGLWLQTSREAKTRCYAARKAGALDTEWLESQLRLVRRHPCGPTAAELSAEEGVTYQDLVTVMDRAIETGFVEVGLSAPAELAVPLVKASKNGSRRHTPANCPMTVIAPDPDQPATTPLRSDAAKVDGALDRAPVVVITSDKVSLAGNEIATVASVGRGRGTLVALAKALPAPSTGTLILQADRETPMGVIHRVVETAKRTGYGNVLFAVANK